MATQPCAKEFDFVNSRNKQIIKIDLIVILMIFFWLLIG